MNRDSYNGVIEEETEQTHRIRRFRTRIETEGLDQELTELVDMKLRRNIKKTNNDV